MDAQDDTTEPSEVLLLCTQCGPTKGPQPLSAFPKAPGRPYGVRKTCKACKALDRAAKNAANPEKHQAKLDYIRQWHAAHPTYNQEWEAAHVEHRQQWGIDYRAANKEALQESMHGWRASHAGHISEYNKQYAADHPEEGRARNQRNYPPYYAANKPAFIARARLRRLRLLNAPVLETFRDEEIFERDKWICQICFEKVNKKLKWPDPGSASIDHVIPIAKGGSHCRQNVVLAHRICNSSKGARNGTPQQQRLF
jgi:Restriction endonuclease